MLGNWQEVKRWTNVPTCSWSYYDSARPVLQAKTVVAPGISPVVLFSPDTQVGYRIVELPPGFSSCVGTTVGTCAYTATMAYMPKATNYGVGRVQLVLKTTQATAGVNGASLHVRAKVSPFNETWLDSTRDDFQPGSYLPYDLSTSYVTGLQDVQYIDVWTPDAGGICVGEVTLTIDGRPAFDQQYPSCVWVMNGSALHVPFAAIRSNTLWKTYAPDTFLNQSPPLTFIGFDSLGLAAHLDSIVGSKMRDHNSPAGPAARLGATTTLTRRDASHMHVQQHLNGLHVVYNQLDLGVINADPSYDLVIHHADATCTGWCVHVENFDGGAGYSSGVTEWLFDVLSPLVDVIEYEVNDSLAASFKTNPTSLSPPAPFTFCFPDPNTPVTTTNPAAGRTSTDQGHTVVWDSGSLTICGGYTAQN
ncbi:MAG TPA: hypothetical protein VFQ65_19195 [Kofleriaceae bacterium]|nr:hypothetical protein [Kofleriaceae bacterium]